MAEARSLERNGYQVLVAESGEAALALVGTGARIDLVLMDIDLGAGMDGTEAARRILALRDLPLVFLSAHTEPQVVEKTEGISSYGYIVKNSGETVLLASIRMAFRLFEARRELRNQESHYHSLFENFFGPVWIEDFSRLKAELARVAALPGQDLRAWIEAYPERIYELADLVTILDLNHAALRVLGLREGDPVPGTLRAFLGPEARAFFPDELCALARGDAVFECVVPVALGAGGPGHYLLHLNAVKGHEEDLSRVQVLLVDITASREAVEKLRILFLAVDQSARGIILLDKEGRILFANQHWTLRSGYSVEELRGQSATILKVAGTPPEVYAGLWEEVSAGREWRGELASQGKDGKSYSGSLSITPVKDDKGRITHFFALMEDSRDRP